MKMGSATTVTFIVVFPSVLSTILEVRCNSKSRNSMTTFQTLLVLHVYEVQSFISRGSGGDCGAGEMRIRNLFMSHTCIGQIEDAG